MEIAEIYNSLRSGKSVSANDYYHMVSEGLPLSAVPKHQIETLAENGNLRTILAVYPEEFSPEIASVLENDDLTFLLSRHPQLIRMVPNRILTFRMCLEVCSQGATGQGDDPGNP